MKNILLFIKVRFLQLLLTVVLTSVVSVTAFGQTYEDISDITKQKLDSTYNALIKKHKIVGTSIAIVDNGKIVYSTGYGYADLEAQKPATDKTIYRTGSITKSFTTISVLQLQQKSVVDINDPLSKYLTDFSIKNSSTKQKQNMIIKDILSHTSGMPCAIFNGFFVTSPPDQKWYIDQLKNCYTLAEPGFLMAYSNIGYTLLGEMVARTSGLPYEDYVSENIFKPLNMKSSGVFLYHKDNPEYSMGYVKGKAYKEPFIRDIGAGMIHSNVLDMANYTLMYLNNGRFNNEQILSETLIKEMQKDRLSNTKLISGYQGGYGLFMNDFYVKDLETNDSTQCKYIGHGGDTFAYHANFGFMPELGVGAVILTNTDNGLKITSIPKLLKVYLKYEKNKGLSLVHDSVNIDNEHEVVEGNAVLGNYSSYLGMIKVKDENKIKASKGLAKIVLKKDAQKGVYTGKTVLFGFIPVKLKNSEFYFEKVDGEIYLKSRVPSVNAESFMGVKAEPQTISQTWKNAVGKYKFAGKKFELPEEYPYNVTDGEAEIKIEDGFIVCSFKPSVPEFKNSFLVKIIDNKSAVGYTYGRNTGETITLLGDDMFYYSGFTFKKIK